MVKKSQSYILLKQEELFRNLGPGAKTTSAAYHYVKENKGFSIGERETSESVCL